MDIDKMLDEILCTLNKEGVSSLVQNTKPFIDLVKRTSGNESNFKELAEILEKDKYVRLIYPNDNDLYIQQIDITIRGRHFIRKGGYKIQNRLNGLKVFAYTFHIFILSCASIAAIVYYTQELISKPAKQSAPTINISIDKKILKSEN